MKHKAPKKEERTNKRKIPEKQKYRGTRWKAREKSE